MHRLALFIVLATPAAGASAGTCEATPGRNVRLTGIYSDFNEDRHVMWLEKCRPEQ